jgi:adenylate cyclase
MESASPTGVEIERKFVLAEPPAGLGEVPGDRIEQGYLAIADDGVEIRVRRRAGRASLTVKSGPGQVRTEEEIAIDDRRFESLWPLTDSRRVTKTRHEVPLEAGLTAELDVYDGAHDGLVTAEIEFESVAASERFSPPAWLGREVTGDARYANQTLAVHGPPPAG